jgi:hypothetical protein
MQLTILLAASSALFISGAYANSKVNFSYDDNCQSYASSQCPSYHVTIGGPFGSRSLLWVGGDQCSYTCHHYRESKNYDCSAYDEVQAFQCESFENVVCAACVWVFVDDGGERGREDKGREGEYGEIGK